MGVAGLRGRLRIEYDNTRGCAVLAGSDELGGVGRVAFAAHVPFGGGSPGTPDGQRCFAYVARTYACEAMHLHTANNARAFVCLLCENHYHCIGIYACVKQGVNLSGMFDSSFSPGRSCVHVCTYM